jgi:hypothetical protein
MLRKIERLLRDGNDLQHAFKRYNIKRRPLPKNERDRRLNRVSEKRIWEGLHHELPIAIKSAHKGKPANLAYILGFVSGMSIP